MKGVAHVSFEGGGLIVPAHTPYQRELLFEHVEASTKRRGDVQLRLNGRHWTISSSATPLEVCTGCPRSLDKLTYRFDAQALCGHCARRAVH